jgi:hypothetical protein
MKRKNLQLTFCLTGMILFFLSGSLSKLKANTPPEASDNTIDVHQGVSYTFNLQGSDEETSIYDLEFSIVDDVDHGSLDFFFPDSLPRYSYRVTYTSDETYSGTDHFTYKVHDGTEWSGTATVTINVAENMPPEVEDMELEAVNTSTRKFKLPVSDDITSTSKIQIVIIADVAHGTLESAMETVPEFYMKKYTPDEGYTGNDQFTYKAVDEQGNESEVKTVTINVKENTAPVTYPANIIVLKNIENGINYLHFFDPDEEVNQNMTFELIDSTQNGALTYFSTSFGKYTYIPNHNFTGKDSFTWRVTDGASWSEIREVEIMVIEPGNPSGTSILVVVPESIYTGLKSKIDRLINDLNNEGHDTKLKLWNGGDDYKLWQYLQSEYRTENQFLGGAIFIGKSLPEMDNGDIAYWNMLEYNQSHYSKHRDIWVSRFDEDDITKLGYGLDANHRYRTGQSRLPYDAYRALADEFPHDTSLLNNYKNVWDRAIELDVSNIIEPMTKGAEVVYRGDHNHPSTGNGPFQCRFAFINGCYAANHIGNYQFTREGSNLMSVGSKEFTAFAYFVEGDHGYYTIDKFCKDDAADLLNQKASLGHILNNSLDIRPFKRGGTYYFGDLSLPVKNNPPGVVPAIDEYNASTISLMAGEKVDFSVTISDPDAGDDDNPALDYEHKVEWFFHEYFINEKERIYQDPVITTTSNQSSWDAVSYIFDQPHNYDTRVEVQDEWYARAWKHKEIIVKPNPLYPLRINLGTYSGHDTYFPDYTDDDGNVWLYQEEYNSGKGNWGWQDGGCGRSSNNGKPMESEIGNSEIDPVYWYWNNICDDGPSYLKVPIANDTYTVNIHVADMKSGSEGERLLDAWIEGNKVLDGFDAYKEAGSKMAVVESFTAEVTDGELTIKFLKNSAGSNDAMVNAIEILPQGVNTYTITASTNTGGSISPSGEVSVTEGSGKTFIIEPDENYEVADVKVNGGSMGVVSHFTFTDVDADQTIAVTFREVAVPVYTITASAGMHGQISPLGEIKVEKGAGQSFTITPNVGYKVLDVKVDSVSQGILANYEFTDVAGNHTIEATFISDSTPIHTITALAGKGGVISPSGEVQVAEGASQNFAITPDAGYKVLDVKVNSVSQGILANYEFTDVAGNHTIEAIFAKEAPTSIASGNNHKDKVNVYPMPFEGHIFIEGLDKGKALVSMYNINGMVVLEQTIETTGTLVLDGLQQLEKGIYLINIQQEKRSRNIKVIKI